MAITRTAMIDDDGSGTTGTVINNAWKTELYDQIDGVGALGGAWTPMAFNPANFVTNGGAWTVGSANVEILHWLALGRTMFVQFRLIGNMTLAAPAGVLSVVLPGLPIPIVANPTATFHYYMAGAIGTGVLEVGTNSRFNLQRDVAAQPFPAFTTAYFMGQFFYAI